MHSWLPRRGTRRRLALLAVVLACPIACGTPTQADPRASPDVVEATLAWVPELLGPERATTVSLGSEPPLGAPMPASLTGGRYTRLRWGEGTWLLLASDVSTAHPRVWVDANLDGSLADETRDRWSLGPERWTRHDIVRVRYGSEGIAESVPVRVERRVEWPDDRVQFLTQVHRLGSVVLGGRVRRIALMDGDTDARFDDAAKDRLYLDLDGDGELATHEGSHELLPIGSVVRVGDEGWVAAVPSPSGRRVSFARAAEVPARAPRAWVAPRIPASGVPPTEPNEPLAQTLDRVEAERRSPYLARYDTIARLGRYSSDAACARLLRLAALDPEKMIRAAALRALGHPAWLACAGPALLVSAQDEDVDLSTAAVEALHAMGHPERHQAYLAVIARGAPVASGQAMRFLGYMDTPVARTATREGFEQSRNGWVRLAAYEALRLAKEGPDPQDVRRAARDSFVRLRVGGLRDAALLALPDLEALALDAAQTPGQVDDGIRELGIDLLGRVGSRRAVDVLLAMADTAPPAVEEKLHRALAPLRGPDAITALLAGLKAPGSRTRSLCAQVLSGVQAPAVFDALLARVPKERDPAPLLALLEALGNQGDPRAVPSLLVHARGEPEEPRRAALRALARLGLPHAKVRPLLVGFLSSKEWEERVLALDAVAAAGETSLIENVVPNLAHARFSVCVAAVQCLTRLRVIACIQPLIARLAHEREPRVRDELATALYLLTGTNLYDDHDAWSRWWEDHGAGFEVPASVPPLPHVDAGDTRAAFYGLPVVSGRVVFVIDQSQSMGAQDRGSGVDRGSGKGGSLLDTAVREVLGAVKGMEDHHRVSVVLFATMAHPWRPGLEPLTPPTRAALEAHLLAQEPYGPTNLQDALERALTIDDADTVFLLSDGAPSAGRLVAELDILREVRRLNQTRRTAIHTVSLGGDSTLLQRLAAENGGRYVWK